MSCLILIPARAGSKGLPGKNTKLLGGKPLINYSIEFAAKIKEEQDVICISTDDKEVVKEAKKNGVEVPFIRPAQLATDTSTTFDVILHALEFYKQQGRLFDTVLLLQPTSPFRTLSDFERLKEVFDVRCDMAVTVKISKVSPYFNLFEESGDGFLKQSKEGDYMRRQDAPEVYAYNGSMYLIRVQSLQQGPIQKISRVKKVIMPAERSVDIDTMLDWIVTEFYLKQFEDENS